MMVDVIPVENNCNDHVLMYRCQGNLYSQWAKKCSGKKILSIFLEVIVQ